MRTAFNGWYHRRHLIIKFTEYGAKTAMKILIVRLSALGDVIHGLPVAAVLKDAIPGLELTWLVEKPAMDVLVNNPAIDRVIVFPKKEWKAQLRTVRGAFALPGTTTRFVRELRSHRFNAAIDLQGLLKSALLTVASGAPYRFGFRTGREGADLFLTDRLDVGDYFSHGVHVVDLNLKLAEFVLRKLSDTMSDKHCILGYEKTLQSALEVGTGGDALLLDTATESCGSNQLSGTEDREAPPCIAAGSNIADMSTTTAGSTTIADGTICGLTNPKDATSAGPGDGSMVELNCDGSSAVDYLIAGAKGDIASTASTAKSYSYICDFESTDDERRLFPLPAPSAEAQFRIENLLNASLPGELRRIALIPGTTWISKIWPVSKWCALVELLRNAALLDIILIGGPAETATNKIIEESLRSSTTGSGGVFNLTGTTTLPDLIAIFQRLDLVIGADTGPLHLAAAVGHSPVLGVYGSTPTKRNGPYGSKCRTVSLNLDCQPCFKKVCPLGTTACLYDLPAELVFEEALNLLTGRKP